MLKATGERLVPDEQREELVYAEHLARYRLAAQLVAGRRVLDAGSGEGYGAELLRAAGAKSVVGVDVDPDSVNHARDRYGLGFLEGDICELDFANASFDLVVCFETIEHLQDGSRALGELRRVLTDDGLLVISTPNPREYLVENEFHEREYTPPEFDQLLARHFPERVRLYQQNWLLSAILDEAQLRADDVGAPLELELVKAVALEPGRELYSIVVCGASEGVRLPVGVATGLFEAQQLAEDLRAWQERGDLAERQRQGWEKRATTAERQREAWEERAAEAERQLEDTRDRLARTQDAYAEIATSISWRITAPLRWMSAHLPFH